jgi:hypothetical protein
VISSLRWFCVLVLVASTGTIVLARKIQPVDGSANALGFDGELSPEEITRARWQADKLRAVGVIGITGALIVWVQLAIREDENLELERARR